MINYLKSQLSTPVYLCPGSYYIHHPIYFCESLIDKHNHHHKTSKYYVQIGSRISAGDTLRGGLVDCCKLFTAHESFFFFLMLVVSLAKSFKHPYIPYADSQFMQTQSSVPRPIFVSHPFLLFVFIARQSLALIIFEYCLQYFD